MADLRSLAAALRRYPDPVDSTDPLTSTLVARLTSLPDPPEPASSFRESLRAQLVAVTPRLVAEGLTSDATSGRTLPLGRARAAWRRMPFRRPLAVVGTLMIIFAVLLTGAVWLSNSTLPGDSLYGLKRASENVQLSLLTGDSARGKEYLTLAKRRATEVAKLLSRASALGGGAGAHAAGGVNDHTAKLVTDTLAEADADARNASRLLTGQAVRNASHDPLRALLGWAPDQVSRLTTVVGRIPPGALHDRAVGSEQLAEGVRDRAGRLDANIGCSCLSATSTDDLGPLPCTLPCDPPASSPATPRAPATNGPTAPPGGGAAASSAPAPGHSTTTGGAASASLPNIPGLPAPAGSSRAAPIVGASNPGTSANATGTVNGATRAAGPITLTSCGLMVRLGRISIGIGSCGLNLHL